MTELHLSGIAMVGLGGAIGSMGRYLISFVLAPSWLSQNWVPAGTLTVNVLGCLLLSFLAFDSRVLGDSGRQLVLIGMLGGFTTFSTFGYETFELFRSDHTTRALLNVGLNVFLGLAAVWIGALLARGRG